MVISMREKIRVLVVDDSAFMRKWLSTIISSDPGCEVIKTAKDGIEALKAVEELRPDVVTMDIQLPEIDGLTCIAYIMERFPTPILVVTGFSDFLGEETIKALEYGAVGHVRKPRMLRSQDMVELRQKVISEIKLASQVSVTTLAPVIAGEISERAKKPLPATTDKIVVIAASSGGPRALSQVIPKLPADLPAGVIVIQHMPAEFLPYLADRLNQESALNVKIAEDLEPIKRGKVLFAPANFHCEIESKGKGRLIKLVPVPGGNTNHLISADKPMISLAPIYGKNATAVILTGMGNDGTEGLRAIRKYGGHTIAEDKSTCLIYGMPKSAIEAGLVDKIVPLHQVAHEIIKTVSELRKVW
jgi:two-component system chemotaxis response regulator CheB